MPTPQPSPCRCPDCLCGANHPDAQYHRELRLFLATLNDEQRRLYAAVESHRLGRGGAQKVAQIMGLCQQTVAYGRRQLADLLEGKSLDKKPHPVGGRPRTEEKFPAVTAALQEILSDEVAGDPMGERTWVRNSVRKLAGRLRDKGFPLSSNTVWRFLKRMGFSMKTGVRKRRGPTRDPAARDVQFQYIAAQKEKYAAAGLPIISVDAKKKELIGNFRNNGRAWCKEAPEVSEARLRERGGVRGDPLRRLRPDQEPGLRRRGPVPQHARVCRHGHRTVVGSRRPRHLSERGRGAYPRRRRRGQRQPMPGLEVEVAGTLR